MLLSLGAIGASEKYIGEGRWGMAATEILLCLLFLYPTFREVQKALRKKKAKMCIRDRVKGVACSNYRLTCQIRNGLNTKATGNYYYILCTCLLYTSL